MCGGPARPLPSVGAGGEAFLQREGRPGGSVHFGTAHAVCGCGPGPPRATPDPWFLPLLWGLCGWWRAVVVARWGRPCRQCPRWLSTSGRLSRCLILGPYFAELCLRLVPGAPFLRSPCQPCGAPWGCRQPNASLCLHLLPMALSGAASVSPWSSAPPPSQGCCAHPCPTVGWAPCLWGLPYPT